MVVDKNIQVFIPAAMWLSAIALKSRGTDHVHSDVFVYITRKKVWEVMKQLYQEMIWIIFDIYVNPGVTC